MNTQPSSENCPACTGRGWLIMVNSESGGVELQRCDSCSRFGSDTEAQEHVSTENATLAAALREFCSVLYAETDVAVNRPAPTQTELKRLLRRLRNSLQNAADLKPQEKGAGLPPTGESKPRGGCNVKKHFTVCVLCVV